MGRRAVTEVYCFYLPAHPPHKWSPYRNTPGEGEFTCLGWHGRPGEFHQGERHIPEDANYTTAWHDHHAAAWDMFLPKRIRNALEIGSHEGRSANWLLRHRSVGHLTCVDPFEPNADPCSDVGDYSTRFDRNVMQPYGAKVTKIRGYSPAAVPDGDYDLVYVDGEHSYEQALADLERVWPMIVPGGICIVDDIALWTLDYGALRAAEAFFDRTPHEIVFTGYQYAARKP